MMMPTTGLKPAEVSMSVINDSGTVDGTGSRLIRFKVLGPGPISLVSTPASIPHSPSVLDPLGQLILYRPSGAEAARQSAKLQDRQVEVDYQVTAADVAMGPYWTARLYNRTAETMSWQTTISGDVASGQVTLPQSTASFDLALLSSFLQKALDIAQPRLHIESDGTGSKETKLSYLTWSNALTGILHSCKIAFHIDNPDYGATTINGWTIVPLPLRWTAVLDSDPASWHIDTVSGDPPGVTIWVSFQPTTLHGPGETPPLKIDQLTVRLDVGFDGTVKPTCTAEASVTVLAFTLSESDNVQKDVVAAIPLPEPAVIRSYIDQFFGRLLRLPAPVTVNRYRTDGLWTLYVDYAVPEGPPVGPPVAGQPIGAAQ